MKKKFLSFALVLTLLIPLSVILTACSFDKVRYIGLLPDVFEAELHQETEYYNRDFSVIKRTENIQGHDYSVYYAKYHYQPKDSSTSERTEEWLCIWNESTSNWDFYRWDEDSWSKKEDSISQYSIKDTMKEVRETATYMTNVDIKKSDLIGETDEYLEYKWGGKYPDTLRVSKNRYNVCLQHDYNRESGTYATDKFTKFVFDNSTTAIPHITNFSF